MSKFINKRWLIFEFLILFLASFHNISPKVIDMLFSIFNCDKIDSESFILLENPGMTCFST